MPKESMGPTGPLQHHSFIATDGSPSRFRNESEQAELLSLLEGTTGLFSRHMRLLLAPVCASPARFFTWMGVLVCANA